MLFNANKKCLVNSVIENFYCCIYLLKDKNIFDDGTIVFVSE